MQIRRPKSVSCVNFTLSSLHSFSLLLFSYTSNLRVSSLLQCRSAEPCLPLGPANTAPPPPSVILCCSLPWGLMGHGYAATHLNTHPNTIQAWILQPVCDSVSYRLILEQFGGVVKCRAGMQREEYQWGGKGAVCSLYHVACCCDYKLQCAVDQVTDWR